MFAKTWVLIILFSLLHNSGFEIFLGQSILPSLVTLLQCASSFSSSILWFIPFHFHFHLLNIKPSTFDIQQRDNPLRCSQMDCQKRCWQEGGPWRTERENNGCADSCHCSWFQFIHWQRWRATITLCVQWSQKCNNGRAMHWNRRQSSCGRTPSFHCIWLPPRIHPPQHISYGSHLSTHLYIIWLPPPIQYPPMHLYLSVSATSHILDNWQTDICRLVSNLCGERGRQEPFSPNMAILQTF